LQRVTDDGHDFDVFVDYAHTDDALRNVLSATRQVTRGRLWCVFGCGGDRDRTKRPLMARAVSQNADAFVVTSDNPRSEDPDAIIEDILRGLDPPQRSRAEVRPDRADAIRSAVDRLAAGDTLIVAGKGHEDYQIIDERRIHFDDVDCVRDALARRRKSEK
jgi:UDP-N-acetylmuramyl tripeptide synthase